MPSENRADTAETGQGAEETVGLTSGRSHQTVAVQLCAPSRLCGAPVSVQPHGSGLTGTMQSEKPADTAETGQGAEETVGLTSGRSLQTVALLLCAPFRLCGAPVSVQLHGSG